MKNVIKTLAVASVALFVTACNTVEGVGQDVESAGEKIEETANDNK
jgi:predicted small secreted protein